MVLSFVNHSSCMEPCLRHDFHVCFDNDACTTTGCHMCARHLKEAEASCDAAIAAEGVGNVLTCPVESAMISTLRYSCGDLFFDDLIVAGASMMRMTTTCRIGRSRFRWSLKRLMRLWRLELGTLSLTQGSGTVGVMRSSSWTMWLRECAWLINRLHKWWLQYLLLSESSLPVSPPLNACSYLCCSSASCISVAYAACTR